METSRDSSVWRNLAVTFGGGLALGAVGMKLTQTALRPVEAPAPRPEPNTYPDRLSHMERRLERLEQPPASAHGMAAAQPIPAAIDQKVLEAVIGAVDARLHEHAGQVDRRLADVEARLAVMQGSHQQDRHAADQLRQEAAALRTALESDLRQMRESTARTIAGQSATHSELQAFRQQQERAWNAAEQRILDAREEFRREMADLRVEMEQSVEGRAVSAAAAAVTAQMEDQLAPLRAEIQRKEGELAELRQRLAESEKSVLDVVLAIGVFCRQAAERITGPREPQAAPPPPGAPLAEPRPKLEAVAPPPADPAEPSLSDDGAKATLAPVAKVETMPAPQAAADPPLAPSIPDFLHENNHPTNWRIPLVSSVLVCTGYLFLMHYLSASLQ
jgi:hypothetical protein